MQGELSVVSAENKSIWISLLLPTKIRSHELLSFEFTVTQLMRELHSKYGRTSVYISSSVSNFSTLKAYFNQTEFECDLNLLPLEFELPPDKNVACFVWFDSVSDLHLIERLKALRTENSTLGRLVLACISSTNAD